MLTISHTDDGTLKVEDKATGFAAKVNVTAVDQLVAALRYAASIPPTPTRAAEGPKRKPRAAKSITPVNVSALATSIAPAVKVASVPSSLTQAIQKVMSSKPMTVTDILSKPAVVSVISSDDPKRQRATVAAALTRMERAGAVVNVADTYKLKA